VLAGRRRNHERAYRIEHDLELRIVPLLQLVELARQPGMGSHGLSQRDEHAHDLDVHGDRARAPQHARQHRDTLLREGMRKVPSAAPSL